MSKNPSSSPSAPFIVRIRLDPILSSRCLFAFAPRPRSPSFLFCFVLAPALKLTRCEEARPPRGGGGDNGAVTRTRTRRRRTGSRGWCQGSRHVRVLHPRRLPFRRKLCRWNRWRTSRVSLWCPRSRRSFHQRGHSCTCQRRASSRPEHRRRKRCRRRRRCRVLRRPLASPNTSSPIFARRHGERRGETARAELGPRRTRRRRRAGRGKGDEQARGQEDGLPGSDSGTATPCLGITRCINSAAAPPRPQTSELRELERNRRWMGRTPAVR